MHRSRAAEARAASARELGGSVDVSRRHAAVDSLRDELRDLDQRVERITERGATDASPAAPVPLAAHRQRRQLLKRLEEAAAALAELDACTDGEWEERFRAAESAIGTLFHATWFVEHGQSFVVVTGAHPVRPASLVAKSLARRRGS